MKEGLVIKSTGSWYTVEDENGETFECKIKGKFRIKGIKNTNPVAVGDRVGFTLQQVSADEKDAKIGLITAISERKNYIIRRSINLSKQAHIVITSYSIHYTKLYEKLGTRHPLSLVKNEIIGIFARLGFTVAEGPEIEDDWHVFSALNFPPEHPARDMQDTFFIEKDPDVLLSYNFV